MANCDENEILMTGESVRYDSSIRMIDIGGAAYYFRPNFLSK